MARISRLDRTQVTPEIAARYDKVFAQRGNVPNMFRVMAHRPEIFATMQAHFAAVLNTGTVSTKLKELIIVRTSQVNETPYCLASHTILARSLGWSDDQLSHLADWQHPRRLHRRRKGRAAPGRDRHPRRPRRHRRAVRRVAQLLLRRRNRRAALRHRPLQLLQPLQQRPADGAHQARRRRMRSAGRRAGRCRRRPRPGVTSTSPISRYHRSKELSSSFMKLELPAGTFRAYLFDCDGTIVDSMPLHYMAWKKALAEYGAVYEEELFYAWGGRPIREIIRLLNEMQGLDMPVEKSPHARKRSTTSCVPTAQAHPGSGRAHRRQARTHPHGRRLRQPPQLGHGVARRRQPARQVRCPGLRRGLQERQARPGRLPARRRTAGRRP